LTIRSAAANIDALIAHPKVEVVGPKADHWAVFSRIVQSANVSGDVIMDAHIAAIAIEHNASVASCDRDFRRFSDYVKIIDPTRA
jgi:predicted nucleic acid-binding protein